MQLLHQVPQALPRVKEYHASHSLRNIPLSASDAGLLLKNIAELVDRTQIVIDGLDEVEDESETQELLDELRTVPAQLLILSRPHTLALFRSELLSVELSIQARNEDVVTFVKSSIASHRRLAHLLEGESKLCQEIVDNIREKSEGMYVAFLNAAEI